MPIHCVIVPPPLYSPGSWLKDRRGYGLFSPSSFDNPIFFCVWCSSLCSLNKSPVPALIIALPPKVWCAQGNWTSPVPAHYSTIHYCLPAKHTSTYSMHSLSKKHTNKYWNTQEEEEEEANFSLARRADCVEMAQASYSWFKRQTGNRSVTPDYNSVWPH